MEFVYTAYTKEKKLIKGKVSAADRDAAASLLNYGGFQVLNLTAHAPAFQLPKSLNISLTSPVKLKDLLMLSRQLALLLESGTDLVNALDLLQRQITSKALQKILQQVITDIHGGSSFSAALSKHPRVFSPMYIHAMAAGEQAGNLDMVLRQMADYMERDILTRKKLRGALTYPVMVFIIAIVVVGIMSVFVFPTFVSLFSQFGAKLPFATRLMIGMVDWASHYAVYVIIGIVLAAAAVYAWVRTPDGKLKFDKFMLYAPVIGRIINLNELSRTCRTMALLFKVGLPIPEILGMAVRSSTNKFYQNNLTDVQQELIRGEGLSRPMSRRPVFLPMMVQMVAVGEETGNLDNALTTVAMSYETEADDRTSSALGMLQPALTIIIAIVVGFVAVSLISAMYGIYGQVNV